jgi:2,4-dienoyl-CoA reductase-like NADH-dependent reductase (Old Yellow Enzyme family)
MTDHLFSPISIGNLDLPNRIIVAPMCQYSSIEGVATEWHVAHGVSMALSGAGLFTIEATGVNLQGRITPQCLGLFDDESQEAIGRIVTAVREYSDTKIGLQIGHAGRKASTYRPWEQGRGPIFPDKGGWQTVAPSALLFADGWPLPRALTQDEMAEIKQDFINTTKRAAALDIDYIEIHSAHGYLLSTFLSSHSNHRDDEYGGDLENRMRYPMEVVRAVREAWPIEKPMGVKFNGTNFTDDGWGEDEDVIYAKALKDAGVSLVTLSGGGVDSGQKIDVCAGYQLEYATAVKANSDMTAASVGMIYDPKQADDIIRNGDADMVSLARAFLFNPRWGLHAAQVLGVDVPWPHQYERGSTKLWPPGAGSVAGV